MTPETVQTSCCIVGGGPAGVMLGYLLARAGVPNVVLEKHKDFFRDFRGDTVHPSTMEVLNELGILDQFLRAPHQELQAGGGVIGDFAFQAAKFSRLPTRCKFIALMPQWDFLDFLATKGRNYSKFDLRMEHEAVGLVEENGKVVGVEAATPAGRVTVRAHLVVACDGRNSTIRRAAKLEVDEFGVPIDVLWFRISRTSEEPEQVLGTFNYGAALILIPRGDYFQAGFLIRKNSFEELQAKGLEAFRERILRIAPHLRDRVAEVQHWDQVKLLSVQINRLRQWYRPGLLCIGDAAHAMSPIGGVGINLAIQDAVAAANLLAQPLQSGTVPESLLQALQERREFPAKVTQSFQKNVHKFMDRAFRGEQKMEAPWLLKAFVSIPGIQHVTGRAIGLGVRPEHVADVYRRRTSSKPWILGAAFCAGALAGGLFARRKYC